MARDRRFNARFEESDFAAYNKYTTKRRCTVNGHLNLMVKNILAGNIVFKDRAGKTDNENKQLLYDNEKLKQENNLLKLEIKNLKSINNELITLINVIKDLKTDVKKTMASFNKKLTKLLGRFGT